MTRILEILENQPASLQTARSASCSFCFPPNFLFEKKCVGPSARPSSIAIELDFWTLGRNETLSQWKTSSFGPSLWLSLCLAPAIWCDGSILRSH